MAKFGAWIIKTKNQKSNQMARTKHVAKKSFKQPKKKFVGKSLLDKRINKIIEKPKK